MPILDGMRDFEITKCEEQEDTEFLEWQLVVDDSSSGQYEIAYFSASPEQNIDIERARFVPMNDKYHTDCYAQIAFESGVLYRTDQEVVIEETVAFVVDHLWALIGLVVGVVLLFCGLCFAVIVLWRKHVEMKEFVRADSFDKDDDDDRRYTVPHHLDHIHTGNSEDHTFRRVSAIDLEHTTPGGMSYASQSRGQRRDSASVPSQSSFITPSRGNASNLRTQYEYDMRLLSDEVVEEDNGAKITLTSSESESSDDGDGNMLKLKGNMNAKRNNTRRPSILGVTREQLKMLQDKDTKTRRDDEADRLLRASWPSCEEEESEISQGL